MKRFLFLILVIFTLFSCFVSGSTILIDSLIQGYSPPKSTIWETKTLETKKRVKKSNGIERFTIPGLYYINNYPLFKPEIYRFDSSFGSVLFIATSSLTELNVKCLNLVFQKVLSSMPKEIRIIREFKINKNILSQSHECQCLPEINIFTIVY